MSTAGAAWMGLLGTPLSTLRYRRCPLTIPSITHFAQGVSRPVDHKSTSWLSTFARVTLRLPPSSRITSLCRRRGGRTNAFPIQSPVGDRRLGLCGVGVSHCKAESPTACTGIFETGRDTDTQQMNMHGCRFGECECCRRWYTGGEEMTQRRDNQKWVGGLGTMEVAI
ncbi:hypothetical protein V8D89_013862 [Ganoderma adspersum]